jgi:N utilization substance protein A
LDLGSYAIRDQLEMQTEFIRAINQVCAERRLTVEVVLEAVEQALVSAYKRDFGSVQNLTAKIDPSSGEVRIFTGKEVVEEVENPKEELDLAEAIRIKPDSNLGDIILIETTPPNFGRIAAQTAKQVILQRIREAEREVLYETYMGKEGEIVGGTVQNIDAKGITIALDRAEALLPRSQQVPSERHHIKQKLRVLIIEVNRTNRGPEITVSRSHPDLLRRLLELEVPEIYNGLVEIKAIAREAGSRAKVAVAALQEGIDPVGACVGMRGVRIQSIVSELNGEKIDVIQWSPDPKEFIGKALSPARPLSVKLTMDREMGKTATVAVPDRQLSLAIGREGQNARLAAKLTGWRIDIINATEAAERALREAAEEAARAAARAEISEEMPLERLNLPKRIITCFAKVGITELGQLLDKMEEGEQALLDIKGFGLQSLQELEQVLEKREVFAILGREKGIPEEVVEPKLEEVAAPGEETEAVTTEVMEKAPTQPSIEEVLEKPKPEEAEEIELAQPEVIPEKEEEVYFGEERPAKKKQRRRTLVYDETLGEIVAKKIRKPGRRREEWEQAVDNWQAETHDTDASTDVEEEQSVDEEPDAS